MIKAIFSDFNGTIVQDGGEVPYTIMKRICESGDANTIEDVFKYWINNFYCTQSKLFGENYTCQHEIALDSLDRTIKFFNSTEDAKPLCDMLINHWCMLDIYEDAKAFIDTINIPFYIVSNSDDLFVEKAISNHGLKISGLITSEQAKYSKPQKEIFVFALNKACLCADEVIYIGDSIDKDVEGPMSVGMSAVWLNRHNKEVPKGINSVSDFYEFKKLLSHVS